MPTCANNHESQDGDFCSVCGIEMTPLSAASRASATSFAMPAECPKCHAEHEAGAGPFCEICGYNFHTGAEGVPFAIDEPPPAPKPATSSASAKAPMPEPGAEPAPVFTPTAPLGPAPAPSSQSSSSALAAAEPPPIIVLPLASSSAGVADSSIPATKRWEFVATVDLSIMNVPEAEGPADRHERVFHLDLAEELVGRRSQRRNINPEISLDTDDGVSHRHAKVILQPDGSVSILDMGSSNGTAVNGVDLKPNVLTPLAAGDSVCIGRWTCLTLRPRSC